MTEMQFSDAFETPSRAEDQPFPKDGMADTSGGSDGVCSDTVSTIGANRNRRSLLFVTRAQDSNVRKSLFRR